MYTFIQTATNKIKTFDYFHLGNSFVLYYILIFFSVPLIYFIGIHAPYFDSIVAQLVFQPRMYFILLLGLLFFTLANTRINTLPLWFSNIGLNKGWRKKNVLLMFAVLLLITVAGKVIMFLNGHYLISSRLFHMEPLWGSVNSGAGFGRFTGYFELPGLILIALSFVYYFYLLREKNETWRRWRVISWSVFMVEVVSGFLTGNRLPVITAIMVYAVVRHYAYQKSWKHFFGVIVFVFTVIMPLGALYERPGDVISSLQKHSLNKTILDTGIGRFSQNLVVSSVIEKTENFSYGKNFLNFFVSLGPPRFIWKDKPIISFEGNKFGRGYGIINDFDFNTNVGPTMVGDLYMNFGLWGIFAGLFILGLVCKFIFALCISSTQRSLSGVMLYAILWPGLIKGMENDVASVFAGAVKLAILVYLIHLCLTVDWGRIIERIVRWRHYALAALFVFFFVGDTIRKLIPEQPWQIMLILDGFLFLSYILFALHHIRTKKSLWRPPFLFSLLVFALIFFASVLGPYSAGIKAGVIGFRNYLWFVPLMFLGYTVAHNKEKVLKLCRYTPYVAFPLLLFSIIQLMFPSSSPVLVQPFNGGVEFHSGTPLIPLTSSLFGSAQRYGMVALFLFLLCLGIKNVSSSLVSFAAVVLSGSRSAFTLSVLGFLFFIGIYYKNISLQHIQQSSSFKILIGILVILLVFWNIPQFSNIVSFQIHESIPMIITSRIGIFFGEMQALWKNHISAFGYGAGSFSQGTQYVTGDGLLPITNLLPLGETGIRNLLLEMGIVGLFAFYFMWGSILWIMNRERKKIQDNEYRRLGLAIFIFAIAVLLRFTFMHGQTLNDYAVLIPLWFFIGVFFKLKSYENFTHRPDIPAGI